MSLQEVDVNAASAPGYRAEWRRLGYHVVLSALEQDTQRHRVALVSRAPCRPVSLEGLSDSHRVAAGLIEIQNGREHEHVLMIALYGYPSNQSATDALFQQVQQAMLRFGGLCILFGDFNMIQEAGAVGDALRQGTWHSLDETAPHLMLPTNPTRTRRIDFALCHRRIWATELRHFDNALSDHRLVAYKLNIVLRTQCFARPRFSALSKQSLPDVAAQFDLSWKAEDFALALQQGEVDRAWAMLSDSAEKALAEGPADVCRSQPWQPTCQSTAHAGPTTQGHASPTLRVVRKLHNQLGQLCAQPYDRHLQRKTAVSLRNLRAFMPEVPYFSLTTPEPAFQWCAQLHQQLTDQEKQAALARWRQRLSNDCLATTAWVKRKAAETLQDEKAPVLTPEACHTVHPAAFVAREAKVWTEKWSKADHALDYEAVDAALNALPEPAASTPLSLQLDADMLRKAAGAMKNKAAGADQLGAEALLRLPAQWWQALAALWNCILDHGQVPRMWRRIVVSLIPKKPEESRPIGLCPVVWRVGAKAINRLLRPWLEQWLDECALGAAPGRGTADAHGRILLARNRGVSHFVKQDLSAFFDTIDLEATMRLLRKLGAPAALGPVIRSFYQSQVRIFKCQHFYSPAWVTVERGVVQGCPLSPTIALAFGRLWSAFCRTPHTQNLIFVDDRAIWPKPGTMQVERALDQALDLCNTFDTTFGFKCRATKCAAVQPPGDHTLNALARRRGYPVESSLELLGVVLTLEDGNDTPLKLDLKVLRASLRYLRLCDATLCIKRQVYRSLVASAVVWAAGVATPDDATVTALRNEVKATLRRDFTADTPWVLLCAVHGWTWDPQWQLDYSALQTALRWAARPPCWLEVVGLDLAFTTWRELAPQAVQVCRRLGWTVHPQGDAIMRTDDYGVRRTYRLGHDHPRVLQQWLTDEYQLRGVHQCGRVKNSLHRSTPEHARGLDLPAPAPGTRLALLGHKCLGLDGSLETRRAALASGGTGWYAATRLGQKNLANLTCMCGGKWPSRPHVTWSCPHTSHARAGVTLPTDRAQERLFGAHLRELPAPPAAAPHAPLIRRMRAHFGAKLAEGLPITCATDGSSRDDVGACAVVTDDKVFSTGDASEDQSPFRFELLALWLLFSALEGIKQEGTIHILCDCQAAIQALRHPTDCCLPALARQTALLQESLRHSTLKVFLHWIPSHGKHATWESPNDCSAVFCRALNDKADSEANRCRDRVARNSHRARWHQDRHRAQQWELQAICAAAEGSLLLQKHVASSVSASNRLEPSAGDQPRPLLCDYGR